MARMGAMGKRIFAIVFASTVASMLIFGSVTLVTLSEDARKNGQNQLETLLLQLRMGIEQEYMQLLHLTQHMLTSGPVGQAMSDYLHAQDVYEQGAAKRRLTKSMSTYSGLSTLLVMYYDADTHEEIISNLTADEAFLRGDIAEPLWQSDLLAYQPIHRSHSLHSGRLVVSLTRSAGFDGDRRYGIYAENTSDAPRIISEAGNGQSTSYAMLQLDQQGIVRYSSDPSRYPTGLNMAFGTEGFGQLGDDYYARADFTFGGSCVVLSPAAAYSDATRAWARRAAVASCVAVALVFCAALMLYRYVFKGLGVFQQEIDKTYGGDLESASHLTGIGELDQLLWHFDRMKAGIQQTMRDTAAQTERLHQREREMLMYQINPHFLLNTLNSLHWLAAMSHQHEISRYVSNLSAILSYNLGKTQQPPTLRSELAMLDMYLMIEQARHDFHVQRDIEDGPYLDVKTPRLILQPIVENAIGHGMDDGGQLRVAVSQSGAYATIVIEDDGCGIGADDMSALLRGDGSGVGLKYVLVALEKYYGTRATLSMQSEPGEGTRVSLLLPLD